MKIVKNNYKKEDTRREDKHEQNTDFPLETECDACGSVISVNKDDIHIGWLGAYFFTCPCCGEESMIENMDGITLNIDNLEFPKHFIRTNMNLRNVKELDAKTIQREIRDCILYLRKHKDEFAAATSCGDTTIHVYRYEDDKTYSVVVSKDYYETEIPFEYVDYADRGDFYD